MSRDWLTLGEAARALGVDPDTLRRWSDARKVDVFTTPGGHRRFRRETIDALAPRPRSRRRDELDPRDTIAAEFRRRVRAELSDQDWHGRLDEASLAWFRERGMRMSQLLLASLDARAGAERATGEAAALGGEYGGRAARAGLSIGEATEAFLFFRARFLAEIANVARRRDMDERRAASLFENADRALDRVIVALVEGHRAASRALA
ncbi:MAG TPA: helix-turn-helix domain-containing protein [Candidatus Limnocylindria bacterium]|nr:helix-turn-helix domain-containing protein [Candidatus Limnocylindria bacterium]